MAHTALTAVAVDASRDFASLTGNGLTAKQDYYAAQRRRLAEEWEAARNQRQDQQFSEVQR